jgi:hypothetical protein
MDIAKCMWKKHSIIIDTVEWRTETLETYNQERERDTHTHTHLPLHLKDFPAHIQFKMHHSLSLSPSSFVNIFLTIIFVEVLYKKKPNKKNHLYYKI